jgi:hypothetical protein
MTAIGTEPEYEHVRFDGGDQGSSRPRLNVAQTSRLTRCRLSARAHHLASYKAGRAPLTATGTAKTLAGGVRSALRWPSGQPRTWPLQSGPTEGTSIMSLGTILVILLVIFLLGGFSGRFGGYGYGYGHGGVGVLGTVLIVVVILVLLGRL